MNKLVLLLLLLAIVIASGKVQKQEKAPKAKTAEATQTPQATTTETVTPPETPKTAEVSKKDTQKKQASPKAASKPVETPKEPEQVKTPEPEAQIFVPNEVPEVVEAPKVLEESKEVETPKTPEVVEAPKEVETPKVEEPKQVETPETPEVVEEPEQVETPQVVETPVVEAPKEIETPKAPEVVVTPKVSETPKSTEFDAYNVDQVRSFLDEATTSILADRIFENNTLWDYPPHLGLRFISEYFVAIHYLGYENKTAFNRETYKKIALSTQLENGSWKQLPDPVVPDGQIDSTIEAYWALKIMGEDINAPHMKKAREWILKYGGLERSSTLTKYFLALFGQYDWENLLYIPLVVLRNESYYEYSFAYNFVAQWVYPHLVAMSYLRYYKLGKDMGPRFSVQELYPENPQFKLYNVSKPEIPDGDIHHIIKLQLGIQQHNGGFGAYTVSSLLNMAALKDFSAMYPHLYKEEIEAACQKAFEFLEETYVTGVRSGYKGMLMHGAWWDNTLIVLGLAEAKVPAEKFENTLEHIIREGQQENGGFCYGYGFEYAPDTDDTALAVMAMLKLGDKYKPYVRKSVNWLISMQNNDGGFGAFHKNKNVNPLISVMAGKIADSAEIFDQSSVDLTAHVMEAWADFGYNYTEPFVQRAIEYIKKEQTHFGSWEARWATNYIHCAGNVVSSLSKLGYDMSEPWIRKAVKWMLSKQNEDGGWGETTYSYKDVNFAGVGVSTPTHTAWVLFGLIELADKEGYNVTDEILRGIEYLEKAYNKYGEWLDESPVGTGHRGILSMQYPAYAKSFPVMAISRYLNKFGEGKTCSPVNDYCRKNNEGFFEESQLEYEL